MTLNATSERHRIEAEELTIRLGQSYSDLSAWACSSGNTDLLELIYIALGLSPDRLGVTNIVDELSKQETRAILTAWKDHPLTELLENFVGDYSGLAPQIRRRFKIQHAGDAQSTKAIVGEVQDQRFLLALLANPIPTAIGKSAERIHTLRTRFRLWLIFQAFDRIIAPDAPCYADKNISSAARFFTKDTGATEDWGFIDEVLGRAEQLLGGSIPTYERYTFAILNAASQIQPSGNRLKAKSDFLKSIHLVSLGVKEEILRVDNSEIIKRRFNLQGIRDTEELARFEDGDDEETPFCWSVVSTPALESDESEDLLDDDAPDTYLLEVDSTQSKGEQDAFSRSFFLQTAEQASYLPWSWDKPFPHEINLIDKWIDKSLKSADPKIAVGAAITWIARHFSRSLFFALRIPIDDRTTGEWSLNSQFTEITRIAPRRTSGWQPKNEHLDLIQPFSESISFPIPANVTNALNMAVKAATSNVKTLNQLWQLVSDPEEKIEAWFNKHAATLFPRVNSGMLQNIAGQEIFNKTGDDHLARILSSHPNSGLPGSCGYAYWDIDSIATGTQIPPPLPSTGKTNIAGSLLTPIEDVLRSEIETSYSQLKSSPAGELAVLHNRYTTFCVQALYAGTGCRHLRSPFESYRHFNLGKKLVYINDKSDGGIHGGRCVPLPSALTNLLAAYFQYLERFSHTLATLNANLSKSIAHQLNGERASVPLFFLLDSGLSWHEMSDPGLPGLPLFNWILPSNLFRHRYSQRLAERGVPIEIIDGWMGHQERAIATYGDYSPRCWLDDQSAYQNVIDECFSSLDFNTSVLFDIPEPTFISLAATTHDEPKIFGIRAREKARKERVKKCYKEATHDLELFLAGRPIEELDEKSIHELGNRMLLRANGLPHYFAALRFQVFTQALESKKATTIAVKRRAVSLEFEKSLVKDNLPTYLDYADELTSWSIKTKRKYIKGMLSKRDARCFGMMLFAIEKKISHRKLLENIVNAKNTRILQHGRKYFLEWSEELENNDFESAVQRHEISYKSASLIAHGLKLQSPPKADNTPIHQYLELAPGLTKSLDDGAILTVEKLIEHVSKINAQTNLVQLPGIVASALSERNPPTSMSLPDFVRMTDERIIDIDEFLSSEPELIDLEMQLGISSNTNVERDTQNALKNTARFYSDVHGILKTYEKNTAKQSASEIDRICKSYEKTLSSGALLLGKWISHKIKIGKKHGRRFSPYARNTVRTYFSSLRKPFQNFAYQMDLLSISTDEVTDFYERVLTSARNKTPKSLSLIALALQQFHRWASTLGVEHPDWSELPIANSRRSVSPGILTEEEYATSLRMARDFSSENSDDGLFLQFILLLAYRFGLRAQEAICLQRNDWCLMGNQVWVLVRNNRNRELKYSNNSRRAVPLLFSLTDIEKGLIDEILTRYDSLVGKKQNKPLLCDIKNEKVMLSDKAGRIQSSLIVLLKTVTGNSQFNIHHCRHSFYSRLAPIFFGFETATSKKLTYNLDHEKIRRVVLGESCHIGRRSSMALARLMGHRLPTTGLKSYCHLITDWADLLTPVENERSHTLENALNTKNLKDKDIPPLAAGHLDIRFKKASAKIIVQILRLASLGVPFEQASQRLGVSPGIGKSLKDLVYDINKEMRFKVDNDGQEKWTYGGSYPLALLRTISTGAWMRLLEHAENAENAHDECITTESPLPPAQEIVGMIGKNRHILFHSDAHHALLQTTLEYFQIKENAYAIYARNDLPQTTDFLESRGYRVYPTVKPNSDKPMQLDTFDYDINGIRHTANEHGALIYNRVSSGIIRNSYEMAIAMIITTTAISNAKNKLASLSM